MTLLESLKKQTVIVADTGDIDAIAKHRPQDATTNPSLLLKVAQLPQYRALVDDALHYASKPSGRRGGPHRRLHREAGGELRPARS